MTRPKSEHRMLRTAGVLALVVICGAADTIVMEVRTALARNDAAGASRLIQNYRRGRGVTPEMLEAESWLARSEADRGNFQTAEKYAVEVYQLAAAELQRRPLDRDADRPLPVALGAAIEVRAKAMVQRGERTGAVTYLRGQLLKYSATSIRARIQKDINLLSLEGKAAPPLQGVTLPKGKTVLLFFWAHWCPDCKAEAAVLKRVKNEFASKGFVLVAPTQKYGYIAGGVDAPPEVELRYIEQIRRTYYSDVIDGPAPVNEENFRVYGASTTPTLVLLDRNGIVRMYHPGAIAYDQLRAQIVAAL